MAPTSTQEEGGEGSGAGELRPLTRARARSQPAVTTPPRVSLSESPTSSQRRRAAKEQSKITKAVGRSRVVEDAPRTTGSQGMDVAASASASAALKQPTEERSRAGQEPPRKRKMAMTDKGPVAEENAPRRSKRRRMSDPDAATVAPASSGSAAGEQGSSALSDVSSPMRQPYYKDPEDTEIYESFTKIDRAILRAYKEHNNKYYEKERKQLELVTLENIPYSLVKNTWHMATHGSCADMVLKTAKSVFGLSSHIDGKLLKCGSGFITEWNEESKVATVLTSSMLICTKSPSLDEWLAKDEFDSHAEVRVHLLDKNGTPATAKLMHYNKHYDLALFEIKMEEVSQMLSFSTEVKCGQEIFVLGRDKDQNFMVNRGNVMYNGPNELDRHHHMFASCALSQCHHGGPVIDSNGQILGMITRPAMKFIPSVLILKCLHMLRKFHCIPRLQTGMKFSAITFLFPIQRERISRKCNIDDGLIVTEVSYKSFAEKAGIRRGDIIESWNGEAISTTLELENYLLRLCEEHLDKGNVIGSYVEIPVGIYYVRKDIRRTTTLKLKVTDDVEVVARGEYDMSTEISKSGISKRSKLSSANLQGTRNSWI